MPSPPEHARTGVFQFVDQRIDARDEFVAVGMRAVVDQPRRLVCQCLLTRHTRPAAHLTVGEQRQATEITRAAREVHLPEEIFEAELQGFDGVRHVALQQFTAG
jgi:hypothetical protein